MKNFTRFASYFTEYVKARGLRITDDYGAPAPIFTETIKENLMKCHIFEVSEDLKRLLALTKCPNKNDMFKLPFNVIFLDVGFKKEEMEKLGIKLGYDEIVGIIVSEGYLLRQNDNRFLQEQPSIDGTVAEKYQQMKKIGTDFRITICSLHNEEKEGYKVWFDVFNVNINISDEYKDKNINVIIEKRDTTNPHARKFIHLFVLNFLNFLHDPRIKLLTVERDEKHAMKRLQKGKFPIPERKIIKLTGELKIYVEKLAKDKETWEYSHSWWVRGHFRTLRNPDYWKEKAGTRIFIPPYIKGKGVLVEKTYLVEETEVNSSEIS